MKKTLTIAAAAAALALAGCSTASMSKPTPPPVSVTETPAATTASPSPSVPDLTGPVGTPFTDTGTDDSGNGGSFEYTVTMTSLIQQGQLGAYESLSNNGDHIAVGKFTISGMTGVSHDDANNLAVVIGSDGQEYQPSFDSVTEGTNFNGGDFTVTPGETVKGIVAFELPSGVKVGDVQWQPAGLGNQAPATWQVTS
jgi:hypothetical protein